MPSPRRLMVMTPDFYEVSLRNLHCVIWRLRVRVPPGVYFIQKIRFDELLHLAHDGVL